MVGVGVDPSLTLRLLKVVFFFGEARSGYSNGWGALLNSRGTEVCVKARVKVWVGGARQPRMVS